ncbi:MAG TPA: LCP family protein [Actinocrinis sp.]|nr:LCP family protein [Actinocrinis sp.]
MSEEWTQRLTVPVIPRPPGRRRRVLKWTALVLAVILAVVFGYGIYVYESTIGSLKHSPLLPVGASEPVLPTSPGGGTAMNILLMGSDSRADAQDCKIGGDCGPGARADSEMILHVSGDRTNATILSIPRDTVTKIPECSTDGSGRTTVTGSTTGMINSVLQDGPACQVLADDQFTGITITGFIMFDFSGVVDMSQDLGGVPVCVTAAVNDKNSGLVLPAGDSQVQGMQALEFLRTRDSFFDGSDLGREEATHYFLSQLINTTRKNMNFGDIFTLVSLAQDATSATTVSDNFASFTGLEDLASGLSSVPNKNITFLTSPWEPDPDNTNRVIALQPQATQVWSEIQDDKSFSAPSGGSAGAAPAAPGGQVDAASVPVQVFNANGVGGRASAIVGALKSDGFTESRSGGDAPSAQTSEVYYPAGDQNQAEAVAAALKLPAAQVQQSSTYQQVSVVIGADFKSGSTYSAPAAPSSGSGSGSGGGVATAPADSHVSNATDSTNECIPVRSGSLSIAHR